MWPLAAAFGACSASMGPRTEVTWANGRSAASIRLVVAWLAAEFTPSVVWMTTSAGLPACSGKVAASRFWTRVRR